MAQSSYQLINLTSDLTLTWPSSFTGGPVVLDINDVNANNNGWKITLPDATLVPPGQNFIFNNVSGFAFQIIGANLLTLLADVASGDIIEMYLIDNSTPNGTWRVVPFGGGANYITQFTAISSDGSVLITNGTVTPPTGIIDFELNDSLFNLYTVNATKFLVIDDTNPLSFVTRELIGGANIIITDGDGIVDNPIIDLNPVVSSLASMGVGDITLNSDTIENSVTDGDLRLTTTGNGSVIINGVTIDASGNLSGVTNLVAPKAYCSFTDTLVGLGNTIVIQDQVNISSVTGNGGTYILNFITPMADTNYGVFITLGSTGGSLPFISNAYYIVKQTTSVTIIVTDASGELVLAVPNGASVTIMSS